MICTVTSWSFRFSDDSERLFGWNNVASITMVPMQFYCIPVIHVGSEFVSLCFDEFFFFGVLGSSWVLSWCTSRHPKLLGARFFSLLSCVWCLQQPLYEQVICINLLPALWLSTAIAVRHMCSTILCRDGCLFTTIKLYNTIHFLTKRPRDSSNLLRGYFRWCFNRNCVALFCNAFNPGDSRLQI